MICKEAERPQVAALFAASIRSVESCMLAAVKNNQVDGKLMQAALEIIVNGAAKSIQQVTEYFQCTLFSAQLVSFRLRTYVDCFSNILWNFYRISKNFIV